MKLTLRLMLAGWRDGAAWWLAWRLPRPVVTRAVARVWAHGTTGRWSGQEVPALSVAEAMRRWDTPEGG